MKLSINRFLCVRLFVFCTLFAAGTTLFGQNKSEPLELENIEFRGNEVFSDSELEDVIISKESPGWVVKGLDYIGLGDQAIMFDSLLVKEDVNSLHAFYFDEGFFKCKINPGYELYEDVKDALLYFEINEGDPAHWQSFDIQGLNELDYFLREKIWNEILTIDSTQRFTRASALENLANVLDFLRDHGYALVDHEQPEVLVDTLKNTASVKVFLKPGKRFLFDALYITKNGEGRKFVDDQLIRDIVSIKPGEPYSAYEIKRSQIRLYRTNLFESAVINSMVSDTMANMMPINIVTSIGALNELVPEIIVNNEENAFNLGLGLSYSRKNFFGNARNLTISVSSAAQNVKEIGYGDARVSLDQPFLFDLPIKTVFEAYVTVQNRKREYDQLRFGTRLTLNFELPRRVYFTGIRTYFDFIRSKVEYRDAYLLDGLITISRNMVLPDSVTPEQNAQNALDSGYPRTSQKTNTVTGVELVANKSNDALRPTKGYSLSFIMEEGNGVSYLASKLGISKFEDPLYLKGVFSSAFYFPIFGDDKSTLAIKFKMGRIFAYQDSVYKIPLNQRLYAGGSNSVRGWRTRKLVPGLSDEILNKPEIINDFESVINGISPGGFLLFEGSIESRNVIYGNFGSSVFVDYGNVLNELKEFEFTNIAVAAGFGLRYYSSFAPIRIDFGFRVYDPDNPLSFFKKAVFRDTFEFHLGIGEAF